MTTAREYLASIGMAKANSRGRFSFDALDALDKAIEQGHEFSDWDSQGRKAVPSKGKGMRIKHSTRVVALPTRDTVTVRAENAIHVVDEYGTDVILDHCSNGHPINRCHCRSPEPPAYLKAQTFTLVTKEV